MGKSALIRFMARATKYAIEASGSNGLLGRANFADILALLLHVRMHIIQPFYMTINNP
jgi:hypothetical protein